MRQLSIGISVSMRASRCRFSVRRSTCLACLQPGHHTSSQQKRAVHPHSLGWSRSAKRCRRPRAGRGRRLGERGPDRPHTGRPADTRDNPPNVKRHGTFRRKYRFLRNVNLGALRASGAPECLAGATSGGRTYPEGAAFFLDTDRSTPNPWVGYAKCNISPSSHKNSVESGAVVQRLPTGERTRRFSWAGEGKRVRGTVYAAR